MPSHDEFAIFLGRHGHRAGLLGAGSELLSGPVGVILGIAAVLYVLIRRLIGEPAEGKRMLLLPTVLILVGLLGATKIDLSPPATIFLILTALAGTCLGVLRGATVRVYPQEAIAYLRYTWLTVTLWAASASIQIGAHILSSAIDAKSGAANQSTLLITLGLGLLAEGLMVLYKATRRQHRVIWQKGKNGDPHTTSPLLDNLQRRPPS